MGRHSGKLLPECGKEDSRHQGSQQSSCPSPGAKHRPGLVSRGRGAARFSPYVLEVCSARKRKQRPQGCKKGDSVAPVPPHGHLPSRAPRFAERYPTGCGLQRPPFCAPLPPPVPHHAPLLPLGPSKPPPTSPAFIPLNWDNRPPPSLLSKACGLGAKPQSHRPLGGKPVFIFGCCCRARRAWVGDRCQSQALK